MHRIGLGHDTHRLAPGKPLIIGGVLIPHETGPVAHSDGDVLLHAITDALLGAAGLGDIGEWFPDNDPQYAGVDSGMLLENVVARLKGDGWSIVNLDCTVHAQRPRLSPFKTAIKERVASLLGLDAAMVNVKAKTGEKVGPVGREEALSADAVVLIERAGS
ncbi:2-C-methyl-D-erythritol 2,4-cyclodiphosphate synthase [Caulifigura coniformis]|uniref:2-C-methyl-D-erythritol 2,4-cyclodiphosphate synthase n=1 Tax=Caulifigura coniformis TaxID=2527983 RepID=A0A517S995_9PLAN|nr:2-C-methyl-D-erythritol 2,4-cyclodiphosphate synthase [Caulifigura coniformis]QDT52695.1 2-C-methyl-D-erythritol 2,4-cyclodiphosphate synthase [Caulifigura coniformis]